MLLSKNKIPADLKNNQNLRELYFSLLLASFSPPIIPYNWNYPSNGCKADLSASRSLPLNRPAAEIAVNRVEDAGT